MYWGGWKAKQNKFHSSVSGFDPHQRIHFWCPSSLDPSVLPTILRFNCAQHPRFYQFVIELCCEKDENKQKRPGYAKHFLPQKDEKQFEQFFQGTICVRYVQKHDRRKFEGIAGNADFSIANNNAVRNVVPSESGNVIL